MSNLTSDQMARVIVQTMREIAEELAPKHPRKKRVAKEAGTTAPNGKKKVSRRAAR